MVERYQMGLEGFLVAGGASLVSWWKAVVLPCFSTHQLLHRGDCRMVCFRLVGWEIHVWGEGLAN